MKHSDWRKLAKKHRRKRIRQALAIARHEQEEKEQSEREKSPSYRTWLREQRKAEEFQELEEARIRNENEAAWLKAEKEAQLRWQETQEKIKRAREERAKQNAKIKLEWEKEQQKLKEIKEQKEKELQEQQELLEKKNKEIEYFLEVGGSTPEHLKVSIETNPNKQLCPFFQKTSACKFFEGCSRNHVRPGVSRFILIPNFYSHYSLEKTSENEHGSDGNLEFETDETYSHFKEFFFDVVPELEKCGRIVYFQVCCNHEPHLRGNVYVEYSSTREALRSYKMFHGRWYGGKQLNVEFCSFELWKNAICGLFFTNRCPKGNACNFLHVFRNPRNLFHYTYYNTKDKERTNKRASQESEARSWRWSESPERISNSSTRSSKRHRSRSSDRRYRKSHSHRRRSRSRSSRKRSESGSSRRSKRKLSRSPSDSRRS